MSRIQLGLIGAGVIGQRHLHAIAQEEDITVTGITDISCSGQQVAEKFSIPFYSNIESLVDGSDLDGVIVATPTEHHASPTLFALKAGLHVLVEKPVVAQLSEAEEVIRAVQQHQRHVLVGHHRRYYDLTTRARSLVQGGEIGNLVCVTGQWNMRKHEQYYDAAWRKRWQAGPVLTNLIHEMDLLRHLCGDICSLSSETSHSVKQFEKEDAAAMVLRFQNGALGTFILSDQTPSPWSWELATGENAAFPPTLENAWRFMGTEGALDFPNLQLWQHNNTPKDWRYKMQCEQIVTSLEDAFVKQIQHFAQVIRGLEQPRIDAIDATATLRATLAVFESAKQGKRINL